MPQPPLPHKEQNLFRQLVKFYEAKQYKKALKAADQVLKKVPNHADTQAFKALTLCQQGQVEEGFALGKIALKNDTKSHVCWHIYGLLYRAKKDIPEAIKAYKFALRLEPDSQQIARDLAFLQIEMRDYQGYIQSRLLMVKARPLVRQNWTGLAVAHHLANEVEAAVNTLQTFEDTLTTSATKMDMEYAEAALYKVALTAQLGRYEDALKSLNAINKSSTDRTQVMEMRAEYLLRLGRKAEAEKVYRALIARNDEYRLYYEQLEKAMGLSADDESDLDKRRELYDSFAKEHGEVDAPKRIPLDFLSGSDFESHADAYLREKLAKGIPSLFANIKALYKDSEKLSTIQRLAESYLPDSSANGNVEPGTTDGTVPDEKFKKAVLYFLAQHYNYHLSRDLSKATSFIEQAIELDPTSVDFAMTRARIWKHTGDTQKASETMNAARQLDERDRYINSKCAKYQLRNNETEAAMKTMSKFTRNDVFGGSLGDLHDMQCMWFITEDGEAYMRQGKYALALKRFTAIADIFDVWTEDQFDFHSFSLRKGQPRAYIDMIHWEDRLRSHPFFTRAALSAVRIYLMLHDDPDLLTKGGLVNGTGMDDVDGAEKKKALKKAKREQEKAEQEKREAEAKKNGGKKPAGGEGVTRKGDVDPTGSQLVQTKEPLQDAMRFLEPMLELSGKRVDAQVLGCEVFLRQNKPLLALKCLRAAASVDAEDAALHEQLICFRKHVDAHAPSDAKIKAVLDATSDIIPPSSSLESFNDAYRKKHESSALHVGAAINANVEIDAGRKAQAEKDLVALLDSSSADVKFASDGIGSLRRWGSSKDVQQAYVD